MILMMSPTDIAVPSRRFTDPTAELQSHLFSLFLLLLSLPAARLRVFAARLLGGVVSIVTPSAVVLAVPTLPAKSTTSTLRLCTPSAFFFNDTATTEIYTLSLHDALPISV